MITDITADLYYSIFKSYVSDTRNTKHDKQSIKDTSAFLSGLSAGFY